MYRIRSQCFPVKGYTRVAMGFVICIHLTARRALRLSGFLFMLHYKSTSPKPTHINTALPTIHLASQPTATNSPAAHHEHPKSIRIASTFCAATAHETPRASCFPASSYFHTTISIGNNFMHDETKSAVLMALAFASRLLVELPVLCECDCDWELALAEFVVDARPPCCCWGPRPLLQLRVWWPVVPAPGVVGLPSGVATLGLNQWKRARRRIRRC